MPSGSGQNKKKWHLAEAMSFLQPFVGSCRKVTSNLAPSPDMVTANSQGSNEPSTNEDSEQGLDDSLEPSPPADQIQFNPKKKAKKSPAEIVAAPMAEYLKAATEQRKAADKKDSSMLTFFKSMLEDAEKLSERRQRNFKTAVMGKLFDLLDEQEHERSISSSRTSFCSPANEENENTGSSVHPFGSQQTATVVYAANVGGEDYSQTFFNLTST